MNTSQLTYKEQKLIAAWRALTEENRELLNNIALTMKVTMSAKRPTETLERPTLKIVNIHVPE